jgi:oligosaccharide repeat unit polymerase
MYLLLLILLVFLAGSCYVKDRDLFSPILAVIFPIIFSVGLYLMQWSSYYKFESISLVFLLLIFSTFTVGFMTVRFARSSTTNVSYKINYDSLNANRLRKVIHFLLYSAILTFIIESIIVFPPLLSNTPTFNYMNFGLPIIHHFISLLKLNCVLTIIYFKITGKKKLLFINLFVAILFYLLIMARLMIINFFLISFISYFIIFRIHIKKTTFIKILFVSFLLLLGFIFLGDLRLGNVGENYIYNISRVDFTKIPAPLALPYIYITVGIQNAINVIESYNSIYYGSITLTSLSPLININPGLKAFQVTDGLTTFIFGTKAFLDFHYFAPIISFIEGVLIGFLYTKALQGKSMYVLFFLSFLFPACIMSFFSDTIFNSSFAIFLFSSFLIARYLKNPQTN